MVKIGRWLVAIGLLLGAALAVAGELKIGFVNAAKLLEAAPQAEAARKLLEKEFADRDRELVEMQSELRRQEERMTREGSTLSEAEQRKLERDIRNGQRELTRRQAEFREDLNLRRNEELRKLQRRAIEVVVALAKEEQFDLVLTEGVIFASDKIDFTERALERLRREFKAAPAQ